MGEGDWTVVRKRSRLEMEKEQARDGVVAVEGDGGVAKRRKIDETTEYWAKFD